MKLKVLIGAVALLSTLLLVCPDESYEGSRAVQRSVVVTCGTQQYTACTRCTLKKSWVEGSTKYFTVLLRESGSLVTLQCAATCKLSKK